MVTKNDVTIEETPTTKCLKIQLDDGSTTTIIIDKETGDEKITDDGPAPPSEEVHLGDVKIMTPDLKKGGKVSGVFSPLSEKDEVEVIFFTNSPGCFWFWTGRRWIWR